MTTKSFKGLVVWEKSVQVSLKIYKITKSFDKDERFGLVNQMRRCAVSIPSNIAEGSRRGTKKDFAQFLRVADGSAAELETQIIISKELYPSLDFDEINGLLEEVQKMLSTLISKIK